MPERENWRIDARVPSRSGAYSSLILSLISAWPSGVILMPCTVPIGVPPVCTGLPFTSWPALMNLAVTV